jgi:hypothetical protein
MNSGRHVLYTPARVRAVFAKMRAELREMHERHVAEHARLRAELDQVRAAFDELRAISLARSRAEVELGELRRLREIGRARAQERDPTMPLN